MNQRAFNLFTALISFILIILSVLLVQSMIQSERNTSTIISNIENESKLRAVGELERADKIQLFNYYVRLSMENWLTKPENEFTLDFREKSWEEVQKDLAVAYFGGGEAKNFAEFASNTMLGFFSTTSAFGNYSVRIDANLDVLGMRNLIQKLMEKSVGEKNFFTVVGCENGNPSNCPLGTFYVNLAVQNLSDEDYEKFPRVSVTDNSTKNTVQLGILPKTNFKIFIPLRLFKAISMARALAHYPAQDAASGNFDETNFNTKKDFGLLSPRIHNELEEMALGMCDKDYCSPRTNPFVPPDSRNWNSSCPGTSGIGTPIHNPVTLDCTDTYLKEKGICDSTKPEIPTKYNPNESKNEESPERVLEKLAIARICRISKENLFLKSEIDFEVLDEGGPCGPTGVGKIKEIQAIASNNVSKNVDYITTWGISSPFPSMPGTVYSYSANSPFGEPGSDCPFNSADIKLGYYLGPNGIVLPPALGNTEKCTGTLKLTYSGCAQLGEITVKLYFEEKNENYKVNKNKREIYKIIILDRFAPFTPLYNLGAPNDRCILTGLPNPQACTFNSGEGWYCKSGDDQCNPA